MSDSNQTLGNRIKLLEAAAEVFSSAGYNGASLRAIAKRADVSFQLIQHHFGTKHDLWLAVVEYLYAELVLPEEQLAFNDHADLLEQFREHLRRMMTTTIERASLRKIGFMEQFDESERYLEVLKPRALDFLRSRLEPYFDGVVKRGLVPGWTAREAALLWSSVVTKNIVDPDFIEFFFRDPAGSKASINQQINLMFRVFTSELAQRNAAASAESGRDLTQAENVIYPSSFQNSADEDEFIRIENTRLKQLVGELTLENRLLSEQLKAAAQSATTRSTVSEPQK